VRFSIRREWGATRRSLTGVVQRAQHPEVGAASAVSAVLQYEAGSAF